MNERDRIEYLMNLYGLTPSQFSDRTGIQRASVSHILSNRNKPSLEILLKIYHAFEDVELAWLVAGEGNPPTAPQENNENQSVAEFASGEEVHRQSNMLFSFMDEDGAKPAADVATVAPSGTAAAEKPAEVVQVAPVNVAVEKEKEPVASSANAVDAPQSLSMNVDSSKRIREIKIFYNNGTYETFVPEKA
jgi:transcriptional regulator with XRE-family HTH domain